MNLKIIKIKKNQRNKSQGYIQIQIQILLKGILSKRYFVKKTFNKKGLDKKTFDDVTSNWLYW